jgi:hypothetical protein
MISAIACMNKTVTSEQGVSVQPIHYVIRRDTMQHNINTTEYGVRSTIPIGKNGIDKGRGAVTRYLLGTCFHEQLLATA